MIATEPSRYRVAMSLLLLLASWACSSAPPRNDTVQERKILASQFAEYGLKAYDQGQYEQALNHFLYALENAIAADELNAIVKNYHSLSRTLLALGETDRAVRSLDSADYYLDDSAPNELRARQAYHRALVALERNDPATARRLLEQALATLERGSQEPLRALILHGLATAIRFAALETNDTKALREALALFNSSRQLNQALGLKRELASNHYMMGLIHLRLGSLEEARSHLRLALELDRSVENTKGMGLTYRALGLALLQGGSAEQAVPNFFRSYQIFMVLKNIEQQRKSLDLLIEALVKAGQTNRAAAFQEERRRLGEQGSGP